MKPSTTPASCRTQPETQDNSQRSSDQGSLGPRDTLTPALEAALWRNVRRGSRYLSRRLRGAGLEIVWAGTDVRVMVRKAEPTARLSGPPGELLLYIFGRQAAAQLEVLGPAQAVATVHDTHFGM